MDTMEIMDRMRTLLAAGQKVDAALLLPHLNAAVTGDAREEFSTWPVCAACHGHGELPVPDLGRNVSCQVEPGICPGNQYGRMSPGQFQAYMEKKLATGEAPLPEGVIEGPEPTIKPAVEGEGMVAYLRRKAERFKA